ncbi:hypothetical protein B0H17DRAFT_1287320 [Mycena rosella]|uniref:Uncharacterized protein n=1 Tax=Mycena rosella TaxID=1033263 RepID=A0AAD7GW83_MYCRO|nr:hypothetical protein B0H17DRAFT_1287320 [Mycena rosella]
MRTGARKCAGSGENAQAVAEMRRHFATFALDTVTGGASKSRDGAPEADVPDYENKTRTGARKYAGSGGNAQPARDIRAGYRDGRARGNRATAPQTQRRTSPTTRINREQARGNTQAARDRTRASWINMIVYTGATKTDVPKDGNKRERGATVERAAAPPRQNDPNMGIKIRRAREDAGYSQIARGGGRESGRDARTCRARPDDAQRRMWLGARKEWRAFIRAGRACDARDPPEGAHERARKTSRRMNARSRTKSPPTHFHFHFTSTSTSHPLHLHFSSTAPPSTTRSSITEPKGTREKSREEKKARRALGVSCRVAGNIRSARFDERKMPARWHDRARGPTWAETSGPDRASWGRCHWTGSARFVRCRLAGVRRSPVSRDAMRTGAVTRGIRNAGGDTGNSTSVLAQYGRTRGASASLIHANNLRLRNGGKRRTTTPRRGVDPASSLPGLDERKREAPDAADYRDRTKRKCHRTHYAVRRRRGEMKDRLEARKKLLWGARTQYVDYRDLPRINERTNEWNAQSENARR